MEEDVYHISGKLCPEIRLEDHGYEPLEQLANTTLATVLTVQSLIGERFVVKTFALDSVDERRCNAVLQEIDLLKRLQHTRVIKYVDHWWNATGLTPSLSRLSVVMEYADNGDLRAPKVAMQKVGHGARLPEHLLMLWMQQILDALAYLHGQSVIHRDIKSSNVFLKDSWRQCLLGDFGISTVLERNTFASSCVGTPAYMPPELFRNEQYSTVVDMWSVGVVFYELMALKLPFDTTSLLTLVYQISFSELDTAALRRGNYSETIISLVGQLLSKDPGSRPVAQEILERNTVWQNFSIEVASSIAVEEFLKTLSLDNSFGDTGSASWSLSPKTDTKDSITGQTYDPTQAPVLPSIDFDVTQDTILPEFTPRFVELQRSDTVHTLTPSVVAFTSSGSSVAASLIADDELREQLLRSRREESGPMSPCRFEALLARLGQSLGVMENKEASSSSDQ